MSLWAITSYFNPAKYRRRLMNYRIFRERLGVPLVAVELSFGGPFELTTGDADILIQLRGGDVMWQKERLLNVALEHVPASCENIAVVDADVIFADEQWSDDVTKILRSYPVAQCFRSAFNLSANYPFQRQFADSEAAGQSIAYLVGQLGQGNLLSSEHYRAVSRTHFRTGIAWAARASLIREHRLYDACIAGSGDRAWQSAVFGTPELCVEYLKMNDRWRDHFLRWARPVSSDVRQRVGCLHTDLFHLWHGTTANRRSAERLNELTKHNFDPAEDLKLNEIGCWSWNSGKHELHRYLAEYFFSRDEDEDAGMRDVRRAA